MSRSYKKQPFMAICGNGSAKQDKIQAHRGERAAHKRAIHKAMKEQDYDVLFAAQIRMFFGIILILGAEMANKCINR